MNSSVSWEYDGKPCSGLEQFMILTKKAKKCAYGICTRDDGFMQIVMGAGDGPYYVLVQLKQANGNIMSFTNPKEMNFLELEKMMHKYASGEDFSCVQHEWECIFDSKQEAKEKKLSWIILLIIGIAVIVFFLLKTV